jgi:vancomycin resistance protein VanJ
MQSIVSNNRIWSMSGLLRRCIDFTYRLSYLYALGLLLLLVQHVVWPQRNGFLALTQVFEPYLLLPLLPTLLVAMRRRSASLLWTIAICCLIGLLRGLPIWFSWPPLETPDAFRFSAATWNIYVANRHVDELAPTIVAAEAQIVALQELTPPHRTALENDPTIAERYPWRYFEPGHSDGMGILSSFPILEQGILHNLERPESFPVLWARLDLGEGRTLMVVTAHPRAPHTPFRQPLPLPRAFDTSGGAADIAFLRAFIDPLLQSNEALLLLGDFNLTEREPAYHDVSAGLTDAYLAAGFGSGNTWILSPLRSLSVGLLRIDYLFSSPEITPLRSSVNCALIGSDHCLVRADFELLPSSNRYKQTRMQPIRSVKLPTVRPGLAPPRGRVD